MIPKIIHQCWYGLEGPLEESPKYHKGYEITADMHPDYEHILWNRETSRQLLADNFPKYLELYDSFRYDIQRMDFDRFVYMAVYGGFYVDLDVWPLKSLNGLINERLILHSSDNFVPSQAKFTNNFIGSEKGLPIWEIMMEECLINYKEKSSNPIYDKWKGRFVLQTTGPYFISRVMKEVLPKYKKKYYVWVPDRMLQEFKLPLTNENIDDYYLVDNMNRGWMDEIGIKNNKKPVE